MRPLVSLPLALPLVAALGLSLLTTPMQAGVATATPTTGIVDSPIDEVIDSVQAPDGTLYAVGYFGEVGAATGGLTRLDGSTAVVDRTFPTVNGQVMDMVEGGSGELYLAGDFVSVAGHSRNGLARLNPDGTLDETWAPLVEGALYSGFEIKTMALDDTALFIGGLFVSVQGQPRQYLAAIDTETGDVLPWAPNPSASVAALATDDTYLYVGGSFTTPAPRIASYSLADLTLRSGWNPTGADQAVSTLATAHGKVYVGGYFSTIASTSRSSLAALDAVTGTATNWNPHPTGTYGTSVDAITIDDSIVYVGGNFNFVNGSVARNRAVALNTDDTGTPTAWNPNVGPSQVVYTLEVTETSVYIGGQFPQVGGAPMPHLARVDKALGTLDTSWVAGVPTSTSGSYVGSIVTRGSQVITGGGFTHMNVVERNGAAAFDSDMRVTAWDPNIFGSGYAIGLSGSTAYVVGDFSSVNGSVSQSYAAAFRTDDTGTVTAWDPQPDSYPYDMVIDGNIAYMVGDFGDVGGTTRNYAAAVRIDDAGSLTSWDPDLDSAAYSIALDGDVAYMVGDFNTVNSSGVNASRYTAAGVRTDDTGSVTEWDPDLDSNAYGVAVADGIVYVVGGFQYVDNTSISPVMRYGAAAFTTEGRGTVTDWDPYVDGGTPYDIEIAGDYAYLGGDFDNLNGGSVLREGLAAVSIDDTGTVSEDWNPVASGGFDYGASYEGGLSVVNGRLAVMGSFRMATLDGVDYPGGLAVLPIPGSPAPPTPTPAPGVAASAPRDARAEAGHRSAAVSWSPPASSGSFAVSTYQVVASPGGATCLTSSLSCTVEDLTNGTAYTFTVKALNGAGWSAASEPSNAATPSAKVGPSVTITGSREGKRIKVTGTTTGFGMGGTLRPWVRMAGQTSFTEGSASILVSVDGTFEWGRRTGKNVSVYVATPDGAVRSNTVRIAAR